MTRPGRETLLRLALAGFALLLAYLVARVTGLTGVVSLENLGRLRGWIDGFGVLAPVVFIVLYALATVAFLPGTPLSLLAGLAFGPVWGTVWTVVGATTGATLAFFVGRFVDKSHAKVMSQTSHFGSPSPLRGDILVAHTRGIRDMHGRDCPAQWTRAS